MQRWRRIGLSYGVRRVCTPLMEDDEDYTRNLATMEAPTRKVVGVKVCEVIEGVDVDKMKKPKYDLPRTEPTWCNNGSLRLGGWANKRIKCGSLGSWTIM
jgi:hypothetical protein